MAGVETNLALGTPNIEAAVAQGLDAPVIPAAPDPMQVQAPGQVAQPGQPNFNFSLQAPQFLQNHVPNDAEFYATPDMVRGQGAEGPIITARAPYVSMGVLANRQAELDRKKEQLAKDRLAFDPYSGIGKASDRYQPAFHKYATGEMDRYIEERAKGLYGGDMKKTYDAIRTDPQEKAAFEKFAGGLEAVGTANQDLVKRVSETMADVMEDKKQLTPEEKKVYSDYLNVQDKNGVPIKGTNSQEFLMKQRAAEALVSQNEWNKSYLQPAAANALQTITKNRPLERDARSKKWVLTTEETKQWDAFKEQSAKYGVEQGIYKNDKEAKEFLDAHYPTSTKETKSYMNPIPPAKGSSKGSSSDSKIKMAVGVTPSYTRNKVSSAGVGGPTREDVITISPSEETSGKLKAMSPRTFNKHGEPIDIVGFQFMNKNGDWKIVGRSMNESQMNQFKSDTEGMSEDEKNVILQQGKYGTLEELSASDNNPQIESYLGTKDLDKYVYDAVGKSISADGTLDQFKEAMKSKDFRNRVMSIMKQ